MEKSNVQKAIDLVGRFGPEEWAEFNRRIKPLRQLDKGAPGIDLREVGNLDADLIAQMIVTTLQNMGVEFTSVKTLSISSEYKTLAEKAPEVMQFIRQAVKARNQQRALLSLGITLLYENMTKAGYTTTARSLMNNIHRLPSIFNQHFPGYAKAGMLGMVLKEKVDVRQE